MLASVTASRQSGFTLIEVLVALLIVSLGIVSVIQVTAKHVSNITELERRMLASWVASNYMAEIRHDAKVDKIRSGGKTERVKLGGHEWRLKANIEETEVEKVFLVTIEVADDSNIDKKVYANVTSAVADRL
ncbi:MAG: type II secretion system minor pseudopilin GspI [Arenicella sp.]|nr:type II secretion system minor pseudopilin GspI [Arenicella sp.]